MYVSLVVIEYCITWEGTLLHSFNDVENEV